MKFEFSPYPQHLLAWNDKCPVCHEGLHIEKDTDFPASMMNCEVCGSEWNEDEVTLNAREDV